MDDLVWLAAAGALVWIAFGAYLAHMARVQKILDRRVRALENADGR